MYKIKQSPEEFIVNEIINLNIDQNGTNSYFLLKKINYNTENAIQTIADHFHIPRKKISYCGNKDKIAITTQYISIENLNHNLRKDFELKDIKLTYLGQGIERLNLGIHEGNKFEIIVSDADEPKEKEKYLNLFGEQRFSNNNEQIGRAIIKKDFKKAIELILENKGNQEDKISSYLANNPNDYIGALRTLPKKIASLYVHSYQSYLFNKICKNWPEKKVPLIGFGTDENTVFSILQSENINVRDFIIRQYPEISVEGEMRNKFMQVKDLIIEKIESKKYKVSFFLGKGSYATVLIQHLFS